MATLFDDQTNNQRLHHLINNSKWIATDLMDLVVHQFISLISKYGLLNDLMLLIDESGFSKKGKKSDGVARQYNGNIGKTDNCQVGVFGALNAGSITTIIRALLYKPGEENSKIDHAKSIIDHVVKKLQIKIQCVCFDAFYGRDTGLLLKLKNENINFMADVPESHKIYLESFKMILPLSKLKRGRKPTKHKPNKKAWSFKEYYNSLRASDFKTLTVRHASKGMLKAKFHRKNIYILDSACNKCVKLTLLIRLDKDGTVYFTLTNYPDKVTVNELAYKQCKRYFVERSFQDNKQALGMNQYECRKEVSWSKHMALCMLAQLFINTEKLTTMENITAYITPRDIKNLIIAILSYKKSLLEKSTRLVLDKALKYRHKVKKLIYLRI